MAKIKYPVRVSKYPCPDPFKAAIVDATDHVIAFVNSEFADAKEIVRILNAAHDPAYGDGSGEMAYRSPVLDFRSAATSPETERITGYTYDSKD